MTDVLCLHRGRSIHPVVRIIPDGALYRIKWPDIGLSDLTNLTRAKAAALEWAQRKAIEDRKLFVAQRLKSLNNFWWSSSPVRQIDSDKEICLPATERAGEPAAEMAIAS
jgi:hypothetical protein